MNGNLKNRPLQVLRWTFESTFAMGIIAYGFTFLNYAPSHDSLAGLALNVSDQIKLGRFLMPVYRSVFGMSTITPFTEGLLALVWIALAAYFAVRMFELSTRWAIYLTAAIFTVNLTVTAAATTYIQWLGPDMLAVCLASAAAYCWKCSCRPGAKRWLALGTALVVMVLALYQCQVSVVIVLLMLYSILCLMRCSRQSPCEKEVLINGLLGIGMMIAAGMLYLAAMRFVLAMTGNSLTTGDYNSISNLWQNSESIRSRLVNCYKGIVEAFLLTPGYVYSSAFSRCINGMLVLCLAAGGGLLFVRSKRKPWGSVLLVLLIALLPLGMNFSRMVNKAVHSLMTYSYWMLYFMVVLSTDELCRQDSQGGRWFKRAVTGLLCLMLVVQVQTANVAGMKKVAEQETTLSVMTRVADRIEQMDDYVPGETPVAFIGRPGYVLTGNEEYAEVQKIVGMRNNTQISYYATYERYFHYVLQMPIRICSEQEAVELSQSETVKQMPAFPQKGSVQNIDGTIVVNFLPMQTAN